MTLFHFSTSDYFEGNLEERIIILAHNDPKSYMFYFKGPPIYDTQVGEFIFVFVDPCGEG